LSLAGRVKFSAIAIITASAAGKTLDPSAGAVVCSFRRSKGLRPGSVSWPELKTYQTSLGFFDQPIRRSVDEGGLGSAGADSNLFHQRAAKESHDPDVIAAIMARPVVVLKRPVGSDGPLNQHAELPKKLGEGARMKAADGGSVASARKPERGLVGRSSVHADSRPSTRRRRIWTRRAGTRATRGPATCRNRSHREEDTVRGRRLGQERKATERRPAVLSKIGIMKAKDQPKRFPFWTSSSRKKPRAKAELTATILSRLFPTLLFPRPKSRGFIQGDATRDLNSVLPWTAARPTVSNWRLRRSFRETWTHFTRDFRSCARSRGPSLAEQPVVHGGRQ
jgi:hypothetical protein